MARVGGFKSLLRRFARERSGAVALTIGIAAVPIMLAAGVALDFVHASAVKTRLQTSLDAAALAAASSSSGMTDKQRIDLAKAVFEQNWQDKLTADIKAVPEFSIEGQGVHASAGIEVPTALMRIVGVNTMPIGSDVTISIPEGKKAEVALVLDYSGSMTEVAGGKVKYVAMREAAIKLVDDLAKVDASRVKIGLVPFSHHVYVTLPKKFVAGQKGSGNWTSCTQDRMYPYNTTDATPTSDDATKWGQPQAPIHIAEGCDAYAPAHLKVLPLTIDVAAVRHQLEIMKTYSWTNISLGVEFGYHLLSPNEPFGQGASYSDKKTKKFMVVLTDGEQTEPAFGPAKTRTVRQGERNLETLCKNAKADGITMITVAFDLDDADTRNRLRDCSTDPDKNFFVAEDDDDIAAAFEEIKAQIAEKIYISG
jgi:Flp pilus assembly protein TadG